MASEFPAFCASKGVRFLKSEYLGAFVDETAKNAVNSKGWEHSAWKLTLLYKGRRLTTDYKMGMGLKGEPEIAGVLYSLIGDSDCVRDRSFEEFCGDLGYDVDSRKAEGIYKACKRTVGKLARFLGDDLQAFQDASQDY